jgi:hypothetical protein
MGFILYIISLTTFILTPVWTVIKLPWYVITFRDRKPIRDLDRHFYYRATLLDVYSNHSLAILFNRIMIKGKGKFLFTGEDRDTISYTLAVNDKKGTLTNFGRFWAWFLNKVDKDHLDKALINKERRVTQWKNPIK